MPIKVPSISQWKELIAKIQGGGISIDEAWPVGSFYVTSDTSFDPNKKWKGTVWERSGGEDAGHGEDWDVVGEVWDKVGGVWMVDEHVVNRWHRIK